MSTIHDLSLVRRPLEKFGEPNLKLVDTTCCLDVHLRPYSFHTFPFIAKMLHMVELFAGIGAVCQAFRTLADKNRLKFAVYMRLLG